MSKKDLMNRIEVVREQMISTGMSKGFTSPETIRLSHMLDRLIILKMSS
ncbi:aspartyl-phosphate phosphatase Spo0E family protein [Neobacillus muris]|nr:aspartyl-phosphate phosphatase Spo0E family protein [Neobacillus muris]